MSEEEYPVLHGLMDKAYEPYQAQHVTPTGEQWTYEEFVAQLNHIEKAAVMVGNFNYQVCNGGFAQWHDNGYSVFGRDLIKFLQPFADQDSVITDVLKILEPAVKAGEVFESDQEELKKLRRKFDHGYIDDKAPYHDRMNACKPLDLLYYAINEKFMDVMEQIFAKLVTSRA